MLKHILILSCLSGFVACAAPGEPSDEDDSPARDSRDDCIHEPSIRGYNVLDEQNLIVSASGRRKYHVVLRRRAHGLRSSWGIVFDAPGSRVCSGFSEVKFRGDFDNRIEAIRIGEIRLLTPEDEEDLLIKFGKKEPEIKQTPVPQEVEGADVEELDPAASE